MQLPTVSEVAAAIDKLATRLTSVESVRLPIARVAGHILADSLLADRDSPAIDVSAMDGYALRQQDIHTDAIPVVATTVAGAAPTTLEPGQAVKIFTGAPLPTGADCVVRREDTVEQEGSVVVSIAAAAVSPGQNIRRQGENITSGQPVLEAGRQLNSVAMAAVASFGAKSILVRRRVRVSILNTGDELAGPGDAVQAWQIRDSNGPTLDTWLSSLSWVEVVQRRRVNDNLKSVALAIREQAASSDAVILTGGVSMGDTDYVPGAISSIGGEVVFHRLPIRPGKPILGAQFGSTLILGLPGNPVSVAVTARVFGVPLLAKLAGLSTLPVQPLVHVDSADDKQLPLTWYRLIEVDSSGKTRLVTTQGSGDLVSLARSAGFVTVSAGQSGSGPWPLTLW